MAAEKRNLKVTGNDRFEVVEITSRPGLWAVWDRDNKHYIDSNRDKRIIDALALGLNIKHINNEDWADVVA